MMYLALSVFFTAIVFLILKEFQRFQLDNFQAIVINYFVAVAMGSIYSKTTLSVSYLAEQSWLWGAIAISTTFIIVFNLMAITAQKGGLSVMSIANKMSVVIPILVGVFLYHEDAGILKITGIVLALLGVWFASKKKGIDKFDKRLWYLPFLVFLGSGLADSLMNHMQSKYVPQVDLDVFSTSLFLFSGLIGIVILILRISIGKIKISLKSWLGGMVLGIPNYFSIYFLLKALSQPHYETALIFSANNVLIVLTSVLLGLVLYKEKLSEQNYLGLGMSVFAIIILYLAV